jgi:hypothetical protein
MKGGTSFIIVFVGSLLTVTILALLLVKFKPEVFSLGGVQPAMDSLSVATAESVKPANTKQDSLKSKHVEPPVSADSALAQTSQHALKPEPPSPKAEDVRMGPSAALDTSKLKEQKSMAKMFDAMDPQSAAKILGKLGDKEIKEVLLTVKKRQGAKILGELDPEQAARIVKMTSQQ